MAAVPSIGRANRVQGAPAPEADLTRALYEQYASQILRYCLHQLGSREEAEDAVQSTFLNAFRGIKRGIVPEAESAWLFAIAHNVCLSRRRSTWRRGRIESPTDFEVVEELAPAPSRRADELIGLQDVLEQMPEQQRRAILLREWQGLSYREIADELELSQAAVETLIFRARRSLAQGLEQPQAAPAKRKRLHAGALGNLLSSAQSFLVGGGAAVKVAATVAVVSAGTVVATAPVQTHAPIGKHTTSPAHHAPAPSVETTAGPSGVATSPVNAGGVQRLEPLRHHAQRQGHGSAAAPAPLVPAVVDTATTGEAPSATPAAATDTPPSPAVQTPADTQPVTPAPDQPRTTGRDSAPGQQKPSSDSGAPGRQKHTDDSPPAGPQPSNDPGSGNGSSNAAGRQQNAGDGSPAAPTPSSNQGKGNDAGAPGPQTKDSDPSNGPVVTVTTPVVTAPVAVSQPSLPAPADAGNGNGKGKGNT